MSKQFPLVALKEVLEPVSRPEPVDPLKEYSLLGIRLDGRGPFLRETLAGSRSSAKTLFKVKENDFIYSRLFAWRGAFGIIKQNLNDCYVSSEFPTFIPKNEKIDFHFLNYWFRLPTTLDIVLADCTSSTPLTRNRFKENFFLALQIPLPQLEEQQRIVCHIDSIAAKIEEACILRQKAKIEVDHLKLSHLTNLIKENQLSTVRMPLDQLILLERRPIKVIPEEKYREIGIYCFGKGIFHKRPRTGYEVGNKDLFIIKEGDLILQITFAWEGAIAIASIEEDGLFASIRFPTFRVNETICRKHYLLTYLKSYNGIEQLKKISPGSAGRNRVLSLKRINEVIIPVVPLDLQDAFSEELDKKIEQLKTIQNETQKEIDAILPSILNKAFKGEL
jgi:type I restriction enzyme S subunit